MKIAPLLLCSIILWSNAYAGGKDLEGSGLKGKVKTLKETRNWEYTKDGKPTTSFSTETIQYNEMGQPLEIVFTSDVVVMSGIPIADDIKRQLPPLPDTSSYRTVYQYDGNGQLMKKEEYHIATQSTPSVTTEYSYDKAGKKLSELHYRNGREENREERLTKFTYNEAGRIDQAVTFYTIDGGHKEFERYRYEYDAKGNKTGSFYYDYDTKTFWQDNSWVYDVKGNVIETKSYHPDGTILHSSICKYDKNGRAIEGESIDFKGTKSKTTYSYGNIDDAGNYLQATNVPEGQYLLAKGERIKVERSIEYYR